MLKSGLFFEALRGLFQRLAFRSLPLVRCPSPHARHHDPDGPKRGPCRHRRRRPGQSRPDHRQGQCPQGAPPLQGRGHRRLRRIDGGCLHAVRAAGGQARTISGPAHPRLRRTHQGLAHRPLSAPARGHDAGGRQGCGPAALGQRRRAGARRRHHGDRLRRQLRARGRARARRIPAWTRRRWCAALSASPPRSASTRTPTSSSRRWTKSNFVAGSVPAVRDNRSGPRHT